MSNTLYSVLWGMSSFGRERIKFYLVFISVWVYAFVLMHPQMDVSFCASVSAHTSAGLLVKSISKPLRGLNQAERNFPFISPSLLAFFLSSSVSERQRQLLACLQMQTAALTLSLRKSDYLVCRPSFGTATVSVSCRGLLRGWILCQRRQ